MTRKNDIPQPNLDEPAARSEVRPSKAGTVIALLEQDGGATLDALVSATGWQPHTARAVLSGLKKKGHTITRDKVEGVSRYHIAVAADQ